jgi:hypothetical protein
MEKISRAIEDRPGPVTKSWVEEAVSGKTDWKRQAVEILVSEAYLLQDSGTRGALLYTSTRPYREADDTPHSDLAPTSPHLAPNLCSTSSNDLAPAPPLWGRGARSDEEFAGAEGRAWGERGEVIPEYDHPLPPIDLAQEPDPDELEY